jgi:hypothetical protein
MFSDKFRDTLKSKVSTDTLAALYRDGKPFPHLILDDCLSGYDVWRVSEQFPKPDVSWWEYSNPLERKFAKDDLSEESDSIQKVVATLQSRQFTTFLEKVTGISGLIVDQNLRGGGLHQIARGGKLDIHLDYDVHPITKLDRRLNVILYLNHDWPSDWGGALELWSGNASGLIRCERKIAPTLGRLVVFATDGLAYHGHPDPLECPEGVTRKSIALYYYTTPEELSDRTGHSTIYMRRPQDPDTEQMRNLRDERAKGRLKS